MGGYFPFNPFSIFDNDCWIYPVDVCGGFYPVAEPSTNLYAVSINIKHGIFRNIRVCHHYQVRFIGQIQVKCSKESSGEEVVFLHGICAPVLIGIVKGVFISEFHAAFGCTIDC